MTYKVMLSTQALMPKFWPYSHSQSLGLRLKDFVFVLIKVSWVWSHLISLLHTSRFNKANR